MKEGDPNQTGGGTLRSLWKLNEADESRICSGAHPGVGWTGHKLELQQGEQLMKSKFDTAIALALFWGVWFLTVTLFGKDVGTNGPIGFALTMIVGFTVAYFTSAKSSLICRKSVFGYHNRPITKRSVSVIGTELLVNR